MFASIAPRLRPARGALLLSFEIPFLILAVLAPAGAAHAAGCSFAPQGEGRVAEIIDGRSFRLADGREIRLAGIEATPSDLAAPNKADALTALLAGRDVTLRGEDDTPDRYGRQSASCFWRPPTPRSRACCWPRAKRW
jgi:endonuclease YncB( thermonuclease family)